ncbi:diffusible signal factor-reguated Ax21 faimly protein [Thermomonas sp. HDW16]|uniref:diffusible signal factor-reguated Ax21 faimly protein n=1 Tax=Thermomonas sp. HDW16 TaxID=2714945 RepID=UPI0014083B6B|nr:diffusible signal factor-reguated Ax21 faimly protein [Thermomonas sp. HDW16]QIL19573.1 Ax21 family protein [Thermomonas sp. HDW16]
MKRSLIALALVAALPFAASAQDAGRPNYNFVQGSYVSTNTDAGNADGWGLSGSVAVHPNVHLFAEYSNQKIDHTSVDFDQWRAGVGYNRAIGASTDFVGNVAYEKIDAGAGINADGYSVEAGVRSVLAPQFQGYAMLGYEDGDNYNGDVYGRLGGQFKINQNWGIGADVKVANGGDTQWTVGPRLTW